MATHDGTWGRDDVTLSALVDGELAPEESRRALERLARDARLQARWARYHVVRAACEGAGQTHLRPDFSERLRTALAQEPTVVAPPARRRRSPGGTGRSALAFAASVTLVTAGGLIALQSQDGSPGGDPMVVVDSGAGGSTLTDAALGEPASPAPLTAVSYGDEGEGQQRMAVYLARHNEYAGAGEMPDLVPYSRFASYNAAAR
ncbi:MAG: sigma-E factor negative regulatory protein [Halofilum sp. (in: g-proteobacteria)]